ncbi:hypothetical protein IMCC3317_34380 [Kordia antarctica]|uniref:Uncharacterized protein n=1 Tax=Kordia antarctica TaxID=1218801 RepID=A0A7L4ZQA8_9FLAO|nr:hypothetical protein IMCC3317_34380 [Kordia antarctica]
MRIEMSLDILFRKYFSAKKVYIVYEIHAKCYHS